MSSRPRSMCYGLAYRAGRIAALAVGFLLLPSVLPPAWAVINPRFTPRDLVKGSSQVWVLRVGEPQGKAMAAEVVETLKGQPPATKQFAFQIGEDVEADEVKSALGSQKTATAIVFLYASRRGQHADGDAPQGAIQIETQWFGLSRRDGKLVLDKDTRDFFAIWAGSARMLAAATRYVDRDPQAEFPVRSATSWGESLKLGQLAGSASGCLVADLGRPTGLCAIVLCDAGDRVYRAAPKNLKPADVTAQIKLSTASKAAVVGDFDGDGLVDLISWDGRSLRLAVQTPEGTFAAPKECGQLAACLSLDCIDVGGPRAGLVAGTSQGPVLLTWDAGGALVPQPLPTDKEMLAKLGAGGLCVEADFNGDGCPDVMALFAKGALFYAGEGPGRFKTPAHIALPLVGQPRGAVCGDFDADGLLDVIVAGKDGLALVSRESPERWSNVTYLTGELAYHGNANRPQVTGCAACDVNTDGRQGVAMFYADRKPLLFFNRGFACFGWARELDLDPSAAVTEPGAGPVQDPFSQPKPADTTGPEDLKQGQSAGAIVDLNGDGVPDMLAVGAKGREVWATLGRWDQDDSRKTCVLALPPAARGPVTVTVRDEGHVAGMYVVRPGIPAFVSRAEAGPMTLGWIGPDGKAVTREVVVIDKGSRFEITPAVGSPARTKNK